MINFKSRLFIALAICAVLFTGLLVYGFSCLPDISSSNNYAVLVFSDDGRPLAEFYRERRYYIPPGRIPDRVKNAFIAIEDRKFYSHRGFDIRGIMRALNRDIAAHAVVEGGSTITQQLAKMLLKDPERNFSRKLKEMFITVYLESKYTKNEIMGMYLNLAYFGERNYGIEAAARTYFNKSTEELSIAESALLAALQKAPNTYSPIKNPEKAAARRKIVLDEMLSGRFITYEEYSKALAWPLPAQTYFNRQYEAPYFMEFIKQQLGKKYGDRLYTGGLRIYSTIDATMQQLSEQVLKKGVRQVELRTKPGIQGALVAIDTVTGHIKAMVGGTDFRLSQFNRATMALRQPGSAFKPFVYAVALQQGMSGSDRILDEPISIQDPETGTVWSPKNDRGMYYGDVSLKTAISLSLNAATARLAQNVGLKNICETAARCGIRTPLRPHPSIALGSCEVTLLDLTASYVTLATGKRMGPLPYTTIADKDANVVEKTVPSKTDVFDPPLVKNMRELLRAVIETGTARDALSINRAVYGKTGSTNDYSDAWFIGFDDRLAVGVWIGRDDHTSIGYVESGSEAALPIWVDFMKKVKE